MPTRMLFKLTLRIYTHKHSCYYQETETARERKGREETNRDKIHILHPSRGLMCSTNQNTRALYRRKREEKNSIFYYYYQSLQPTV